jgi:hypothetical protein
MTPAPEIAALVTPAAKTVFNPVMTRVGVVPGITVDGFTPMDAALTVNVVGDV